MEKEEGITSAEVHMVNNAPRYYETYIMDADILEEQINSPDVHNIAISAVYGAGKSSAIKTYLEKHRANRRNTYVNIALAGFEGKENDENELERSILQQLLYSVSGSMLPNSKIERTAKTPLYQSALKTICIVTFIMCIVALILHATKVVALSEIAIKVTLTSACSLLFIIVLYLVHYHKLRKIHYKDLEADFVGENDHNTVPPALINKFLDEVLYFFECTKVDLVIFEDIDRLKSCNALMVKLRELNTLINNSNNCHQRVVFLYAVKDDLFEAEKRAKFFDFILRLPAVVNPLTVMEKLSESTKKLEGTKQRISERLIRNIAAYIPDMRILNNTLNDYQVFYAKLIARDNKLSISFENDKLFALCLYKNLYPADYALLEQKNKGILAIMLDRVMITKRAIELAQQNNYNESHLNDTAERQNFVKKLKKGHATIKEMLEFFNYNKLFDNNLTEVRSYVGTEFEQKGKVITDFLGFLIRRDFIDERYLNYISPINYFSVPKDDMRFITDIRAGKTDRSFKFNNVERAIKYMSEEDFSESGILNYDILSSFDIIAQEKQKLENIIGVLTRKDDEALTCLQDFVLQSENKRTLEAFYTYIVPKRKTLVSEVLGINGIQEWKKQSLLVVLLDTCDGFAEYNMDKSITQYMSSDKFEWECIKSCNRLKIQTLIKAVNPKFVTLNNCSQDLIGYIKANSYYAVNVTNLSILVGEDTEAKFFTENYTTIERDDGIKNYVATQLDAYAEVLLDARITGIGNQTEILPQILKSSKVTLDKKKELLKKFDIIITNIDEYESDLHVVILQYNRMEATWSNVAKAYHVPSDFLKDYILNPDRNIKGNITNDAAARLYKSISKFNMKVAECLVLKNVLESVTNKCNLQDIVSDDTNDLALELLIENNKVNFGNEDWQYLKKYKAAKAVYCKKNEESIKKDIAHFFETTYRNLYNRTYLVSNAAEILLQILKDDDISIAIKNCLVSAIHQDLQFTPPQYKSLGEIALNNKHLILPQALLEKVVSTCEEDSSKVRLIANRIEADSKTIKQEEIESLVKYIEGWENMLRNSQLSVRVMPYSAVEIIVGKLKEHGRELRLSRGRKNHEEGIVRMA